MLVDPPHEPVDLDPRHDEIESILLKFVSNVLSEHRSKSISSSSVKKLTEGLSNTLFAVHSPEDGSVIVKIYGGNSDLIVDRQGEIRFMTYLAQHRMSAPILLTFNNGFIYRYIAGDSIASNDWDKSLLIARKLAQFHSIPLMDTDGHGQITEKLHHYVNLFNGRDGELARRMNVSSYSFLDEILWSTLTDDIDRIEKVFRADSNSIWTRLAVVVCHNDTQCLNFLCDEQNGNHISLIDFEHCARNIWLIDVFNYFIEFAGVETDEPDYDGKYPSREQQKHWLEVYLTNARFLHGKLEAAMTLDDLCDLGDRLRAPIHLYWSLWSFLEALLNAESSDKFDYVKYGKCRLKQYEKYKNEFFSAAKET